LYATTRIDLRLNLKPLKALGVEARHPAPMRDHANVQMSGIDGIDTLDL
jgi:hypothetical protein